MITSVQTPQHAYTRTSHTIGGPTYLTVTPLRTVNSCTRGALRRISGSKPSSGQPFGPAMGLSPAAMRNLRRSAVVTGTTNHVSATTSSALATSAASSMGDEDEGASTSIVSGEKRPQNNAFFSNGNKDCDDTSLEARQTLKVHCGVVHTYNHFDSQKHR